MLRCLLAAITSLAHSGLSFIEWMLVGSLSVTKMSGSKWLCQQIMLVVLPSRENLIRLLTSLLRWRIIIPLSPFAAPDSLLLCNKMKCLVCKNLNVSHAIQLSMPVLYRSRTRWICIYCKCNCPRSNEN